MGPLMSITSRSNLQSGWLPVRTAVATGTGGTTTCLVTVSEPVRQPPVQATGWTGVVDGDGVWLELAGAELAGAELDWPELGGAELVQAATLTATAASAVQSEAKAVVWRRIACSRYEICLAGADRVSRADRPAHARSPHVPRPGAKVISQVRFSPSARVLWP